MGSSARLSGAMDSRIRLRTAYEWDRLGIRGKKPRTYVAPDQWERFEELMELSTDTCSLGNHEGYTSSNVRKITLLEFLDIRDKVNVLEAQQVPPTRSNSTYDVLTLRKFEMERMDCERMLDMSVKRPALDTRESKRARLQDNTTVFVDGGEIKAPNNSIMCFRAGQPVKVNLIGFVCWPMGDYRSSWMDKPMFYRVRIYDTDGKFVETNVKQLLMDPTEQLESEQEAILQTSRHLLQSLRSLDCIALKKLGFKDFTKDRILVDLANLFKRALMTNDSKAFDLVVKAINQFYILHSRDCVLDDSDINTAKENAISMWKSCAVYTSFTGLSDSKQRLVRLSSKAIKAPEVVSSRAEITPEMVALKTKEWDAQLETQKKTLMGLVKWKPSKDPDIFCREKWPFLDKKWTKWTKSTLPIYIADRLHGNMRGATKTELQRAQMAVVEENLTSIQEFYKHAIWTDQNVPDGLRMSQVSARLVIDEVTFAYMMPLQMRKNTGKVPKHQLDLERLPERRRCWRRVHTKVDLSASVIAFGINILEFLGVTTVYMISFVQILYKELTMYGMQVAGCMDFERKMIKDDKKVRSVYWQKERTKIDKINSQRAMTQITTQVLMLGKDDEDHLWQHHMCTGWTRVLDSFKPLGTHKDFRDNLLTRGDILIVRDVDCGEFFFSVAVVDEVKAGAVWLFPFDCSKTEVKHYDMSDSVWCVRFKLEEAGGIKLGRKMHGKIRVKYTDAGYAHYAHWQSPWSTIYVRVPNSATLWMQEQCWGL